MSRGAVTYANVVFVTCQSNQAQFNDADAAFKPIATTTHN